MERVGLRWASIGLLFAWCGAAYGEKLLRGVHLTLAMDRGGGKDAVADPLVRVLGTNFPYLGAQTLLIAVSVAIGITLVGLLSMTATRVGSGRQERAPVGAK
jgi:hypothetical protein